MTWKKLSANDPGSSTQFGGNDINKISDLLNGTANVDTNTIASDWRFNDTRCKFLQGSSVLSLRTSFIDKTLSYQFPRPFDANDDTLVTNRSDSILENKTISAEKNNLQGFVQMPSSTKWGAFHAGPGTRSGAAGMGLLAGFVIESSATPVFQVGATNGINWRLNTGGSANTNAGIHMADGQQFANRPFHSMIRAKTRVLSGPANTRQYIGFSTNPNPPASDTPLSTTEAGIFVGWRASDANAPNPAIQIFRNGGESGATSTMQVTATNPVVVPSTGVTQYEISFRDTNPITNAATPGAFVRILSARGTTVQYQQFFENNLPGTDGTAKWNMAPVVYASTTGTNMNYDIYSVEVSQDI